MDASHLDALWSFARGDLNGQDFESWFLAQSGLEAALGEDLHWTLTAGDYHKPDEVWAMRQSLVETLRPHRHCECPLLRDLGTVPMGGDGLDERVFETVRPVISHGGAQWWLYLSRCRTCGQHWMIAQDERIFDEYLMRRIATGAAEGITANGQWPQEFLTYEAVLRACLAFCRPPVFLDDLPHSLVCTAHDLRRERPTIKTEEIAELLGITSEHVERLLAAKA